MNSILHERQTSAKCAFSERKPYPGWMPCTSATSAAEIIRGILRYDSPAGAGPMQIAWSASLTYDALRSASENVTTDSMPSSLQARITRRAISPRLAIRMRWNIQTSDSREALKHANNPKKPPSWFFVFFVLSCLIRPDQEQWLVEFHDLPVGDQHLGDCAPDFRVNLVKVLHRLDDAHHALFVDVRPHRNIRGRVGRRRRIKRPHHR